MSGIGASAYLDVAGFVRAATGQETASLLGLNTTLGGSAALAAGATVLPVASSLGWVAGPLWVLDGPYSEVVQVSSAPDGTDLLLASPGTLLAHAPGASLSQEGSGGALAETVLRASAWIENYCRQGSAGGDRSLFALSRSERWGLPGPHAWLDRDGVLVVRPGHFPILAVATLSVDLGGGQTLSLDTTQAEMVSAGRLVEVLLRPVGLAPGDPVLATESVGMSRARRQWAAITYSGGFLPGAVPYDVQQACIWVASDILAQRRNPSGAATVHQGKFELQARPRTDPSGDSLMLLRAKAALQVYCERGV